MRNYCLFLKDILEACRHIEAFVHRLIHGYFGIELKIVWGTVQKDIPPLADEISKILEGESD